MVSSGIRLGTWDYLKRKTILPIKIKEDGEVVVAKIIVSAGSED
jgi:hypothetical protein